MKKAIETIKNLDFKDNYVIVAVSSGPDSMCLLDLLIKSKIKLVVAHVNYHKRKQSKVEEKFLETFCKEKDIIFEKKDYIENSKINFQSDARDFRYNHFNNLAKKYKSNFLFTAHHGDDLMETILMRLTRGSILSGYAGFRELYKEEDLTIVRPLIHYTKEEIISYNKENKIKYYLDKTNQKNDYTRNRFRNKILPFFKEEENNVHKKFYQFSELLNSYDQYFQEETDKILNKIFNNYLDLNLYNKLPEIFKKRTIEELLKRIYDNDINLLNQRNINGILKVITNKKPNVIISLPNQLLVRKSYDKLFFEFEKNGIVEFNYKLSDSIMLSDGSIIKKIDVKKNNTNNYICINSQEIKLPLMVRNRRQGDKMSLKNLGTKKVKEILIESKIDLKEREQIPIVTDSNDNIIWIPGIKKSSYNNNEEYDIIYEYIKEGR